MLLHVLRAPVFFIKNNTTKQAAAPKTLAERIREPDTSARTFEVPAYDESPPAGTPHDSDVEMTAEMGWQTEQDDVHVGPLPFSPMGPA